MRSEQAQMSGLDVDTRTDIYSLGVLLYELLTGVTPADKQTLAQAGFDEVRRMIQETEPPSHPPGCPAWGSRSTEATEALREAENIFSKVFEKASTFPWWDLVEIEMALEEARQLISPKAE